MCKHLPVNTLVNLKIMTFLSLLKESNKTTTSHHNQSLLATYLMNGAFKYTSPPLNGVFKCFLIQTIKANGKNGII